MWAVEHGDLDLVMELLNCKADIYEAAEDGASALHMAAFVGHRLITWRLIRAVPRNKHDKLRRFCMIQTSDGLTPLHIAILRGKPDVAQLLVYNGAPAVP